MAQHALCLLKGPTSTNISDKDNSYRPVVKKETKDAQGEVAVATLNALQLLVQLMVPRGLRNASSNNEARETVVPRT